MSRPAGPHTEQTGSVSPCVPSRSSAAQPGGEMGRNTRPHQVTGSLTNLGMIACERPRSSPVCSQLGVQMGSPEQGTPGQPRLTDGASTGRQTRVSGARATTGVGWAAAVARGTVGLQALPSSQQRLSCPGQSPPVVVTLLILTPSVTSLQGPFFICNLVAL